MFRRFYIGGKENPYMIRWFVIPRNPWFNIYVHKFCRDDDDRALHDHPWWFVSLVLSGSYIELLSCNGVVIVNERKRFSFAKRRATDRHRNQRSKHEVLGLHNRLA